MQSGTRRKRPPGRGNDTRNGTSVRRSPNAWVGADRSTDRARIPTIRPNPCHDDRGYRARNPFRVPVHDGVIRTAAMGFSGKGIVEVSRLVESDVAHLALDRSDADLVLIVSQRVFEDTIAQPHTNYDPAQFRRVEVRKKELHQPAWLFLPGHDIHLVDLTLSTTPDTPEPPAEPPGSRRAAQREPANISHG